jgi:asparagine N-glycosylation enzyme membrane subunit Stt3
MDDVIEDRKKKIIEKLNLKKNWYWFVVAAIVWFGSWIRTRNLPLLIDSTNGKYIPLALDPHVFLRYVKFVYEHGSLMVVDNMRYFPWGFGFLGDFNFLANVIVYLHRFLSIFSPSLTIEKTHVIYPVIAFGFGLVFFFLLVKKLFDYRVGLLATFLLATTPAYLHRTMAGFSDKESLSLAFMFIAFYFFISAWKEKRIKKGLILGCAAGFFTALMGLIWGGVTFAIATIAGFAFINFVMIKFRKRNFYVYTCWFSTFLFFMFLTGRYELSFSFGITHVVDTAFALFAWIVGLVILFLFVKDKFKIKEKIERKLPRGVASCLIVGIFGLFIFRKLEDIFVILTNPFGQSRWALTVAEAHQPYLIDLIGNIGWKFFIVMIVGVFILFHSATKHFENKKLDILFGLFLFGFVFNRYKSDATYFNGDTGTAIFFYLGFAVLFGLFVLISYLYAYKKDESLFEKFSKINLNFVFVLIWFFVMIIAVRSANRLIFVFPIVGTMVGAYVIVRLFDHSLNLRGKDYFKIGLWAFLFLLLVNPISFSGSWNGGGEVKEVVKSLFDKGVIITYPQQSIAQARSSGASYGHQWQQAGKWIRENTQKPVITTIETENGLEMNYDGPVFAHWWDYGYWVQSGGERATVTDGGNAKGSLNHRMGRHFLTGESEIEALEFFKSRNVTHALIISDEIAKYPAFSSIGADANWDRYSWINTFGRDDSQLQETRNGTIFVYSGGTPLDWDFEYNGKLYPRGASGIVAVIMPTQNDDERITFLQPSIVLVHNNEQQVVPLECLYIDGRETIFDVEGYKGCFFVLPRIDGNNVDGFGNGLMISEKVRRSNFYNLYLAEKESEYFKLVYTDEQNVPLSIFHGRLIGPLKIWEVSYPEDLVVPEIFYTDKLADPKVNSVEGRY